MDGIRNVEVQATRKAHPYDGDCIGSPASRTICEAKLPDVQREATRGSAVRSPLLP